MRTVADADAARELAGSFHLVASVDGRVRAQGSVTGFRRLFRAEIDGITVASDRADVLALLGGKGLDEQRLALHLLDPPVLHPLTYRPVWRDVGFVAPDSYLVLDTDGRAREVRWWAPPAPELPLAEGAAALRQALTAAVDVRVGGRELVSSDLSGLDSTSLCCLAAAARAGPKVIACTAASPDPLDDDVQWARITAAAIGRIEHHVIPADEMPLIYHGLLDMNEPLDEPCGGMADYARAHHRRPGRRSRIAAAPDRLRR
ncbi:asparagine synthase-related protein [Streptomyces sp. ISL-96]|uniref:asparagine synthase-related protein n=1 Tax=Streptomyces sp. ISL-96 TaxID=2819191 RepID=UPI0027E2CE49|nr:asparagine synthase-related protein [Streptomyces sp. ISL-96]